MSDMEHVSQILARLLGEPVTDPRRPNALQGADRANDPPDWPQYLVRASCTACGSIYRYRSFAPQYDDEEPRFRRCDRCQAAEVAGRPHPVPSRVSDMVPPLATDEF